MDEKTCKEIGLSLLRCVSIEEVNKVINSYSAFSKESNWKNYGNAAKNWSQINAQTSEPVGALTELIINSIDAILMRKALERGLIAQEKNIDMPHSMTEAVKEFFPGITEGKIDLLSTSERRSLAEKSIIIGIKRADRKNGIFPTYTIIDFGEGQNHEQFPKTLLSLGEDNKDGYQFVQGKYNMGSTGSIQFCSRSDLELGHYKFILSKRTLSNSDGCWGWTIIKARKARKGESLPVVQYFCPENSILFFKTDKIKALNRDDIGVISGGTIVKLYEYHIGTGARSVDFGLYHALMTSLLECALPIRIYDFDAKPTKKSLRAQGIADRTFSGMKVSFSSASGSEDDEENIDMPRRLIARNNEIKSIGPISIYATGVKKPQDYLKNYPYCVFYTVNGQTQAKERKSFLGKAKLDDLRQNLIVQVDCNDMDNNAKTVIFKADRERMNPIELSEKLHKMVVESLKDDGGLREYADDIRRRRVKEIVEETEKGKDLWNDLIKNNPELKELLGIGNAIEKKSSRSGEEKKFEGKKYPSYITLMKPKDGNLLVPINTHRRIECNTDVENGYLGRPLDPGRVDLLSKEVSCSVSDTRNGKLRITIKAYEDTKVGDRMPVKFSIYDSHNRFDINVMVEFTEPEEENIKTNLGKMRMLKKRKAGRPTSRL